MLADTKKTAERAVLVGVQLASTDDMEYSLYELKGLCDTAGVEVLSRLTQKVKDVTPATLIGKGKIEELKEMVEETGANLVIVDTELTGSQAGNIAESVGVKTIDRTTLILDIFAKRATTNEGKLQVSLAQLNYYLPRLSSLSGSSGRFGSGGVGMRGPGETKLELNKRAVRENILRLEKEIEKLKSQRGLRRKNRSEGGSKRVSIVGYTNAGKSTLLNTITKADIYADDKLFATLDTTSRLLWLEPGKQIVLTDTVGFIHKLPHAFVDAFSATLEEVRYSDLIIHVIDLADPHRELHRQVVLDEIKNLGAEKIPVVTVYNKIDKVENCEELLKELPDGVALSAKMNVRIDELKQKILSEIWN